MKTLAELKAAYEAALTASQAKPDDKNLQLEAAKAKEAYDAKKADDVEDPPLEEEEDEDKVDESKLDEKTKKYLAKLRKENGNHRVKGKDLASKLKESEERRKAILKAAGIETEEDKPEEKIKTLTAANQQQAFRNAVLESAVQNGISGDLVDYYEFLITKATNELEEGEELPDEVIEAIVTKVKKGSVKAPASTTVDGGKKAPKPGESGEITLDQFCAMGVIGQSKLYLENPTKYEELKTLAKAKKRF